MRLRHDAIIELYRQLAVQAEDFEPDIKEFKFVDGKCACPSGGICFCPLKSELSHRSCWVQLKVEPSTDAAKRDTWTATLMIYDPAIRVMDESAKLAPGQVFVAIQARNDLKDNTVNAAVLILPGRWELADNIRGLLTGLRV